TKELEPKMASTSQSGFRVNCSLERPSVLHNSDQFRNSLSIPNYKPLLKELKQLSLQVDVPKAVKNASTKLLDAFVDNFFQFSDQPMLPSQSNFAPVDELKEAILVQNIEGKIPDDFPEGVYIRNGPNPLFGGLKSASSIFGKTGHSWIEGEGMLHGIYFNKVSKESYNVFYKNRHVETETLKLEKQRNKLSFLPAIEGDSLAILSSAMLNLLRFGKVHKHISNTNVFEHSGKLYSIAENHMPQEIDIFTLETLGNWDINGAWKRPFTSHPKKAPGTGELVVMGMDATKPFMEFGVDLKFDRCTLCHDMGITERYNIIMDFPLTIGLHRLIQGGPLIKFDKEEYSRIGVMPRYGDSNSVRWFDVEPNCTFHVFNCFEDGDEVVVRGCRSLESIISASGNLDLDKHEWVSGWLRPKGYSGGDNNKFSADDDSLVCRSYEWRLNMQTGDVIERYLTTEEFPMEFPMIHPNFTGLRNKYGYTQIVDIKASTVSGMPKFGTLAKLYFDEPADTREDKQFERLVKVEYHKFEENTFCTGSTFVPKEDGQEEDDGWIITFVHNEDTNTSKPLARELQKLSLKIDHVPKIIKNTSLELLDAFVDSVFQFVDQPLLPSQSNYAPVEELKEAVLVTSIEGEIPDDFPEGVYIRNGSNPLYGGLKSTVSMFGKSSHIWVEGEGMLHALYFGKASDGSRRVLYNNRYVETDTFKLEKQRNKPSFLPAIEGNSPAILSAYLLNLLRFGKVNKHISNTNVVEHSGKFYSTAENHIPQEIDIFTLKTLANWDLNGAWNRPFTSHPKKAPSTGELVIMGVDATKPYLILGDLVHKVDLKLNRCTLCHDLGVTWRYNVIMDFPLTIDVPRLLRGGPLIKYNEEDYARIGIMPRYGDAESVKWFDVQPNCTFHILNCFEDGDEVIVRGCRALDSIIPGPDLGLNKFEWFSKRLKHMEEGDDVKHEGEDGLLFTRCYEWRLNMKSGQVKERYLTGTDFSMDFPMINGDYSGTKNKFGYTQIVDCDASSKSGIVKYGGLAKLHFEGPDSHRNSHSAEVLTKVEYHKFEKNTFCTGAAFVPKPGKTVEEDDGWIITFLHDEDTFKSKAYIIDTKNFTNEPVAKITLPHRVPYGFHGAFMPMRPASNGFDRLKTSLSSKVKVDVHQTIKNTSEKMLDKFVDTMFRFVDQPLPESQMNFAPVEETIEPIEVICDKGSIPLGFPQGVYVRNGPNPLFGGRKTTVSIFGRTNHTWAEGEGMLHALRLRKKTDGNWILSYHNRYVESKTFKIETARNKPCFLPAIEGDSLAVLVAIYLNLLRFGMGDKHPRNTSVFEHAGKLYAIAENYVPQEIDISTLNSLEDWNLNGAWTGAFTSHPKVVVRGCRARTSILPGPDWGQDKTEWFSRAFKFGNSTEGSSSEEDGCLFHRVYEWRLNMVTGEVKEKNLSGTDFSMDFPVINGEYTGLKHKYGYTQGERKYDNHDNPIRVEYHKFPENIFCTGIAFVPKEGGHEEDDGWVITYVHNEESNVSQVYIIDAKKFESEPAATITIPRRKNLAPVEEIGDAVEVINIKGKIPVDFPEGDPPAVIAANIFNLLRFGIAAKHYQNVNIFEHAGKFYTTGDSYLAQEINISTLASLDEWDLNGAWDRPFTSHPKKAPGSGELVIMGNDGQKPYWKLLHKIDLKQTRSILSHEIGVTQKLIKHEKQQNARIGVMPRYGDADSIKWFQVEPNCTFHLVNCFEEGNEVVVRGCKSRTSIIPGPDWGQDKNEWFTRGFHFTTELAEEDGNDDSIMGSGYLFHHVHEWRLDMVTGEVREKRLTGKEYSMDFPFIKEHVTGLKHKYGYTQLIDSPASSLSGITKYGGLAKLYFDEEQSRRIEEVPLFLNNVGKEKMMVGLLLLYTMKRAIRLKLM
ncbi:hypothetical protein Tsubulata_020784, partial [Turnera subulata]